MATPAASAASGSGFAPAAGAAASRVRSIDAVRGLVMFAMIYVNDLAGAPATVVPWWMRHFKADGNGMTFVDLVFRGRQTALLGCMVLLMCLYPADRAGVFKDFWLAHYVGIGGTLGSQASITVGGVLLASVIGTPGAAALGGRVRFTLLFIVGCSAGAWLLHGLYGINKNSATPSWCLWACAGTAALWLIFHALADTRSGGGGRLAKPFAVAGENVLLAYLLHNLLYPALGLLGLGEAYARLAQADVVHAVARSLVCALVVLGVSVALNRAGVRLKL